MGTNKSNNSNRTSNRPKPMTTRTGMNRNRRYKSGGNV